MVGPQDERNLGPGITGENAVHITLALVLPSLNSKVNVTYTLTDFGS